MKTSDHKHYAHDCKACVFLGCTIGGGRMVDLYYHESPSHVTLIARYGSDGPEYLSTHHDYARPRGHAELWAAATLFNLKRQAEEAQP